MQTEHETSRLPRVARVLLDSGLPQLDHLFDYGIPESLRAEIRVGQRVKVPFRSRQRDSLGYVIELANESDFAGDLAMLSSLVSPVSMLTPEVWEHVRAVADRAGGSAADLIRLAIPQRHVRAEKAFFAEERDSESTTLSTGVVHSETEQQHIEALCAGERCALDVQAPPVRLETGEWVSAWAYTIAKTACGIHDSGRSVIIAVPDYRDLDQVHDTLASFGVEHHIRLDSRQSGATRYTHFLHTLEEQPSIVLGNRSAVYAPAHNLGAIVMWDDGDPLFDEPLTPYVHARDAALVRSQQSGAGLLLAAHMRSGEVQRMVDMGYFTGVSYGEERQKIMHSGSLAADERVIGRIPKFATKALRQGLEHGPVLVQVAGPGYATAVVCAQCHDLVRCRSCRGPLGQTATGHQSCRWCGEKARGFSCETCGNNTFEMRGAGSERTAEQFQKMFPETMIIVSDGTHQRSRVDARPAVVVATRGAEPIAAGGYHAVALLDVDRIVGAPSLRAGEDALRWWHGAASLAKREAPVVITGGAGPIVRAFVTGREIDWLRGELSDRQELRFPPAVRVVTVTGARELVQEALETVQDLPGIDVLGPTTAADDTVRAIVRFGYSNGGEVASRLRATLVSQAGSSAARAYTTRKTGSRGGARKGALRLRFDDAQAFDEQGDEHP